MHTIHSLEVELSMIVHRCVCLGISELKFVAVQATYISMYVPSYLPIYSIYMTEGVYHLLTNNIIRSLDIVCCRVVNIYITYVPTGAVHASGIVANLSNFN